jgi:putative redox protein
VLRHFGPTKSEEDGQIQVDLGGRAFRIAPAFIEELQAQAHENPVKGLRAALLVMHAPSDAVVDIGEAQDLFKAARHPKSFISLDDADHLLTRPADAQYAADLIGAWASRFLPMRAERNDAPSDLRAGEVWVGSTITPSGDRCEQVRTTSTPMSPRKWVVANAGPILMNFC